MRKDFMGSAAPPTLRTPLVLLAIADLALLGTRLWPWQEVLNLPGHGTTGIDPAISLLGYIGIIFWITGNRHEPVQAVLSTAAWMGVLAGAVLVAQVVLGTRPDVQPAYLPQVLLAAAAVLWGIAGIRGGRAGNTGIGMLCGAWSAIVSCLIACTAAFLEMYYASPQPAPQDPWKAYEGLATGNPATQALVHSLNTATGFLLIGPLVGGAVGLLFAASRARRPEPAA
jgi:hypothetical protein